MPRKVKELPPVDTLRERLEYNPETGDLRWRKHRWPKRVGAIADHQTRAGYRIVVINGENYCAHRIIWRLHTGEYLPDGMVIDHINHDPGDNRLCNLRLVTLSENTYNTTQNNVLTPDTSRRGIMQTKGDRWKVQINHEGRKLYLGTYDTLPEAIAARTGGEYLLARL
jgi:hypothetical protein